MRKSEPTQILAYALVGVFSVGAAFLISLKFVRKSHAQEEGGAQAAQSQPATPRAPAVPKTHPPAAVVSPSANAGAGTVPPDAGSPQRVQGTGNSELSALEGFLEPFIYDMVNRRDPFLAYSEYVPQDIAAPTRPLSPAQRFDLDQLRLVAIMWDVKDPKAMFMDPEAEVIVLGRDEGIGNRNGYIASIREGEVVVVEAIRKRGDITYKTRVLRIER